jgi:hypothetical protein
MNQPLHVIFESEVRRMASAENVEISRIVDDLAALAGVSDRTIRYYRSGQQPIPSDMIPLFCRRFRSRLLVHALEAQCADCPAAPIGDIRAWLCGRTAQASRFFGRIFESLESGLAAADVREIERAAQSLAAVALQSGAAVRAAYEAQRG